MSRTTVVKRDDKHRFGSTVSIFQRGRSFPVVRLAMSALAMATVASAGVGGLTATKAFAEDSTTPANIAKSISATAPGSTVWGTISLPAKTLVLYDTTGPWGYLGQMYAISLGNLASNAGMVAAQPVVDYTAGEMSKFTAVIYVGSTYGEPIPQSFINDVTTSSTKVLWLGENPWVLDNSSTTATSAFINKYGWDPSTSYFDTNNIASVNYKGQTLSRNPLAGGVIGPNIVTPTKVTVLGTANCTTTAGVAIPCASQARVNGATSFPWAISSANLTYVGENPLSYMTETDRYLALADLVQGLTAPAVTGHTALVRLEDISVSDSNRQLLAAARYLHSQHISFGINLIPHWLDPLGTYSNGVPTNIPLTSPKAKSFVATIKKMIRLGGVLGQEGYTHQYSNIPNPYDGTTADDFEFYRGQCATTASAPYTFVTPCANTDWVIEEGPLPGDSGSWAASRVQAGLSEIAAVGLPRPTYWVTPHYAASSVDYLAFAKYYGSNTTTAGYDRRLYFGGQLSTPAAPNYSQVMGQFFPYMVHDLYGSTVIPENLGDYEPIALNNHPARTPADIVAEAKDNLAVRNGFASFFYDPSYGTSALTQIVSGIQGLGYTFASPKTLLGAQSTTTFGASSGS
ncbi:DUF2334 domain-containing protein [Acidithrix ferrooxidans]|uniref:DUF2334 domain-containing protein n=2 Tax=root TaxID=1 RepID=A0A0D8HEY6_9ACTN|nr:DUF2334 domain-containing protein [Acidithrix ferrooxidans]KJF16530.1 hypothetical protein AXFE_25930 [Acidithrix ferrooxidans]